ncbi:MAG: UDP-N-acetylglucosamine 1-carboxyvinyltransferase [Oscillospiraceae bacterium]|nr:UDP-N-acetylglucosamine 1-carboxyvinyltransferase [Oscillospiraceae bacterium]
MKTLIIHGGRCVRGEMRAQGAKNSALPLLAASLCVQGKCLFKNMPALSDIDTSLEILRHAGVKVQRDSSQKIIATDAAAPRRYIIPESLMRKIRSSIFLLAPLLARFGRAEICAPGGCDIGARPIDLHLYAMEKLGAVYRQEGDFLRFHVPRGLVGADIALRFPSVGATENVLMAAACARGTTRLSGAAREPEIVDLACFLNRCGARIRGAGESEIIVEGVPRLWGCEYSVMPDRIIAASYLAAAANTGGEMLVRDIVHSHLAPVLPVFSAMGCRVAPVGDSGIHLQAPRRLSSFGSIVTAPFPGFPTDCQSAFLALSCTARGTAHIREDIFESRFKQAGEFEKMGAYIRVRGKDAYIHGVTQLRGATVQAMDLRGGAALVIAALAAAGTTRIEQAHLIERGWEIESFLGSDGIVD